MTRQDRICSLARGWIGTPYVHQASTRGAGCDCLGLVRGVRRQLGFAEAIVPAYAAGWGEVEGVDAKEPLLEAAHRHLVARSDEAPRPGQVVVFRMLDRGPAKHCGIMIDRDRFVHAYSGVGTVASALSEPWRRRVAGIFAFPPSHIEEHSS